MDFKFNANDEENQQATTPFDPLPAGEYVVMLDKCERKALKDKDGWRLAAEFVVVEGEYENRKLFHSFNLGYPVPSEPGEAQDKAMKTLVIARGQFGQLVKATGKVEINSTDELLHVPVRCKIKVRPARDGYDATNDLRDFKPRQTNEQMAAAVSGPKAKPAWGRK